MDYRTDLLAQKRVLLVEGTLHRNMKLYSTNYWHATSSLHILLGEYICMSLSPVLASFPDSWLCHPLGQCFTQKVSGIGMVPTDS